MRNRPAKIGLLFLAFCVVAPTFAYNPLIQQTKPTDKLPPTDKFYKFSAAEKAAQKQIANQMKVAEAELKKATDANWANTPSADRKELKTKSKVTQDVNHDFWKKRNDEIEKIQAENKKFEGNRWMPPPQNPFDLKKDPPGEQNPPAPPPIPPESEMPGQKTGKGDKRWLPFWMPLCFFFDPTARTSKEANNIVKTVVDNFGMCGVAVKPIVKTIIPGSYGADDPGSINGNATTKCNADVGFGVKEFAMQSHPNSAVAADIMCEGKPAGVAGCAGGRTSICDIEGAGAATHEYGHSVGKPGRGGDYLVNAGDGKGAIAGEGLQNKTVGGDPHAKGGGAEGSGGGGGFTPAGCKSIIGGANVNDRGMTWSPSKQQYFKHKNPKRWINFSDGQPLWKKPSKPAMTQGQPPPAPPSTGKRQVAGGGGIYPKPIPPPGDEQESHLKKEQGAKELRDAALKTAGGLVGNTVETGTLGKRTVGNTGGYDVQVVKVAPSSNRLFVQDGNYTSDGGGKGGPRDLPPTRDLAGGSDLKSGNLRTGRLTNNDLGKTTGGGPMGAANLNNPNSLLGGSGSSGGSAQVSTYEVAGTTGSSGDSPFGGSPGGNGKSKLDADFMSRVGKGQQQQAPQPMEQASVGRGFTIRRGSDTLGSPENSTLANPDRIRIERGVMFQAGSLAGGNESNDVGEDPL